MWYVYFLRLYGGDIYVGRQMTFDEELLRTNRAK